MTKRFHYHAVIDCPRPELVGQFPSIIRDIWSQTQRGYDLTDIQAHADHGWITYISKLRDKSDFADAIDRVKYHNPD